ncbi:hypothetical protein AL0462_1497 [Bifidobacterium adolescentis]|uniref:Uncharacterized protein n=1 Tax=Bifidobacterium adolescentis TaxID=1680 RepID=A0A1X2ZNB3_BIFAD|nr:hypothetical protein AL0462_1497 [Bifidobacterium adolescentis]
MACNCPVCAWSKRGDRPAEKSVHAFPTPPNQPLTLPYSLDENAGNAAFQFSGNSQLRNGKMKTRPLSEQERVTKEVSTGNYSVNRLTLITAAVVLLLAIVQHM